MISGRVLWFGFCFAIFFITGCPYHLALTNGKNIYLKVINESIGLQMGPRINREVRKAIVRNGNHSLVNDEGSADIRLYLKIKSHIDHPRSFRPDDSIVASGFASHSLVEAVWKNRAGYTMLRENLSSHAFTLRESASALPEDEQSRQALAESIAHEVYLSMLKIVYE